MGRERSSAKPENHDDANFAVTDRAACDDKVASIVSKAEKQHVSICTSTMIGSRCDHFDLSVTPLSFYFE